MVEGNSPGGVVILSTDRRSPWEAVGDSRGLVYSVPSFLRVHLKPMNQMLGGEILSIHVDTRSPSLS